MECDNDKRAAENTITVLHAAAHDTASQACPAEVLAPQGTLDKPEAYCPYSSYTQHFLDQDLNFRQLTKEQKTTWVKSSNHYWHCGCHYYECPLLVLSKICKGKHLKVLHDVNPWDARNKTAASSKVFLKNSDIL